MIGRTGHIRFIFFRLILPHFLYPSFHFFSPHFASLFLYLSFSPQFTSFSFCFSVQLISPHISDSSSPRFRLVARARAGMRLFSVVVSHPSKLFFAFSDGKKGKKGGKRGQKQKKTKKKRKKMRKRLEKWWRQGKLGEER